MTFNVLFQLICKSISAYHKLHIEWFIKVLTYLIYYGNKEIKLYVYKFITINYFKCKNSLLISKIFQKACNINKNGS